VDAGPAAAVDDTDADARGFERVLTEWDSELFGVDVHLRTVTRTGWSARACLPHLPRRLRGELYDLDADPRQQRNLWGRPGPQG